MRIKSITANAAPHIAMSSPTVQVGDGGGLSMDALLGASLEADDPLGLGLPGRLQPLAMAGVQSGSPLSPVVALHNALLTPLSFTLPQVRAASCTGVPHTSCCDFDCGHPYRWSGCRCNPSLMRFYVAPVLLAAVCGLAASRPRHDDASVQGPS